VSPGTSFDEFGDVPLGKHHSWFLTASSEVDVTQLTIVYKTTQLVDGHLQSFRSVAWGQQNHIGTIWGYAHATLQN
jgi:hypothetical protein